MCFSAELEAAWRDAAHLHPHLDFDEFARLFRIRFNERTERKISIPKMLEAGFDAPKTPIEREIKGYIDRFREEQASEWEAELFKQQKRFNDATRALATKTTKKAENDLRVSGNKVEWYKRKLHDLRAPGLKPSDSRIFPMWYAPVIVIERGRLVVKPMRYHCRQNGKPEFTDKKFDGLYNARRDSLEKYWNGLFGKQHGVMVVRSFYENVALHDFEGRDLKPDEKPGNVVLHFNPRGSQLMLVACLWDRWQSPGHEDLLSFAAITDEPPEEVAAAGHDRCIIPLKPENVGEWLSPAGVSRERLYALLDDRARPYYEHKMAA